MGKGFAVLLTVFGLFIASCSTTTDPVQNEANTKSNGSTQAVDNIHDEWEQPLSFYNDCIGEELNGNVNVKVHITNKTMANGNTHYRFTYNVSGVLYDESGNKYVWRDNTFYNDHYGDGGCPGVFLGNGAIRMMTSGGKNNFLMSFSYKYTLDCDNNFEAEYDNFSITCK